MQPHFVKYLLRAFFAVLLLAGTSLPASAEVLKIVVDDAIHPITEEYITRALAEADRSHDQAVLLELDTPGGFLDSTRTIIEKITTSPVPVIIYVTPSGHRAASAGFFILESADIAAMAPGTNTGAAHPVAGNGDDIKGTMKEKMENDAAALMRSVTSKRGRNVEVAESAVRQSKSFTEQEALSQKLIDYVATDEQDLFKQIQGKPFKRFEGQTVTLNLVGQPIRMFDMTLKQRILSFIMDPNIAFILLALGALALYAEFNHPGAVVPGTVGVVFILLAVFAMNLMPVRFAAVILIFASFVLFALEAKFATHGVLGDRGHSHHGDRRTAVGGRAHSRNARASDHGTRGKHPAGLITIFLMTIALKARSKQSRDRTGRVDWRDWHRPNRTFPAGQSFRSRRDLGRGFFSWIAAGQTVVVQKVDGLRLHGGPGKLGARPYPCRSPCN